MQIYNFKTSAHTNTPTSQVLVAGWLAYVFGPTSIIQGDHLSGKPGNVGEFDSCQGNVRDFTKCQGIVREKSCKGKVA